MDEVIFVAYFLYFLMGGFMTICMFGFFTIVVFVAMLMGLRACVEGDSDVPKGLSFPLWLKGLMLLLAMSLSFFITWITIP